MEAAERAAEEARDYLKNGLFDECRRSESCQLAWVRYQRGRQPRSARARPRSFSPADAPTIGALADRLLLLAQVEREITTAKRKFPLLMSIHAQETSEPPKHPICTRLDSQHRENQDCARGSCVRI